jgi:hypothetical protein
MFTNTGANTTSTTTTSTTASSTYQAPAGGGGVTNTISTQNGTVTFGHGGRHIPRLDVARVEQAIANNVPRLGAGQSHNGTININGVEIIYKAYGRGGGIINVGTYYVVS